MSQGNYGEYGGRVLRQFKESGTKYVPGAILKPEDVEDWPFNNRRALSTVGKIEWFGPEVLQQEMKEEVQGKEKVPSESKRTRTKGKKKDKAAK